MKATALPREMVLDSPFSQGTLFCSFRAHIMDTNYIGGVCVYVCARKETAQELNFTTKKFRICIAQIAL